jgi:hypothetical protein
MIDLLINPPRTGNYSRYVAIFFSAEIHILRRGFSNKLVNFAGALEQIVVQITLLL